MKATIRGPQQTIGSKKISPIGTKSTRQNQSKNKKASWIQQLSFNFSRIAPEDWLPAHYQGIFKK